MAPWRLGLIACALHEIGLVGWNVNITLFVHVQQKGLQKIKGHGSLVNISIVG